MRSFLFAAVLALAASGGCSKSTPSDHSGTAAAAPAPAQAGDNLKSLTVDEMDKALAAKEATPVDCNGDRTRKKLGVIPGAILVSDEESFAASELPADKNTKLVFYCADTG